MELLGNKILWAIDKSRIHGIIPTINIEESSIGEVVLEFYSCIGVDDDFSYFKNEDETYLFKSTRDEWSVLVRLVASTSIYGVNI